MLHTQKIIGDRGDCFTASLLSVLGLPYDDEGDDFRIWLQAVVDASGDCTACWGQFVNGWCVARGWAARFEHLPRAKARGQVPKYPEIGKLVIAGGDSPRGCADGHAVVMGYTGDGRFEMVHDPHPSREGLAGEVVDWWWFDRIRE